MIDMEAKINKYTAVMAVIVLAYAVFILVFAAQTTCGVIQSQQWQENYSLALYAGAAVIIVLISIMRASKVFTNHELMTFIVLLIIFLLFVNIYYMESLKISECAGTVLSNNWWEALNWIKNNTKECAVVATYWDPGHFITGIARRPVVFDGASQGSTITLPTNDTRNGIVIEPEDHGISRVLFFKDGTVTRARIQDIGTTLFTSNESLAVKTLKDYKKPGCDELYYIASSDLIGKSQWWTYFATWNPTNAPNYGKAYNYVIVPLEGAKPILDQNAVAFMYRFAQNSAFVLYEVNNTIRPFLQQQNTLFKVEKMWYTDRNGETKAYSDPTADIKGTIWLDSSRQTLLFMTPELENSMFTRMFLFSGYGLKNFEFVKAWGGEVKLFKVNFD
jgi:dolichyl-diphosphooligosaccharide--protein glycosyltransferase